MGLCYISQAGHAGQIFFLIGVVLVIVFDLTPHSQSLKPNKPNQKGIRPSTRAGFFEKEQVWKL